jgi:hypothetical protein
VSNQSRDYAQMIECFEDTEYTISDISYDDFVGKLITKIESDSNACYAVKMDTRNLNETEMIIDTMSIQTHSFDVDSSETKSCYITFFVPFDNDQVKLSGNFFYNARSLEEKYKEYDGKLKIRVGVLDTQPIRVLLDRCWDYDEQREREKAQKYFREHYLKPICQYETQDIKNSFYFFLNWCFVHLYYVYFFIHFSFLWILIWYVYHCFYRYRTKNKQNGENRDSSFDV